MITLTEQKKNAIKKCFDKCYHTDFVSMEEIDNKKVQIQGTHMWSPQIIHFLIMTLEMNLSTVMFDNKKGIWTAIFIKEKLHK